MMRLAALTVAAVCAFAGAAAAQMAKDLTPQIQAYLHSPAHEQEDAAQLKAMEEMYLPGCAATAALGAISPATSLRFDGAGNAVAGSWREAFAVAACDRNQQLSVFWDVDKAGASHASPALPGGTVAPAEVQRDASRKVLAAAALKVPACKIARVEDTYFTRMTPGAGKPPPFKYMFDETWVVSACGELVDVPVHLRFGNGENDVMATTDGAVAHVQAKAFIRPVLTLAGITFLNAAPRASASPAAPRPDVAPAPPVRAFALSLDASAPADVAPAVQAYLISPDHQNEVIRDAKLQFSEFFPECDGGTAKLVAVTATRPLIVDGGKLSDGAWRETYAASGCGASRDVTLTWSVALDGKLSEGVGVPGTTQVAAPSLMNAIRTALVKNAQSKTEECKTSMVTGTHFDRDYAVPDMDANVKPKRVWQETWTISACARAWDARVLIADRGPAQTVHIDADGMTERAAK